jgi:drug/metabolite transporter (DMT)-like permease
MAAFSTSSRTGVLLTLGATVGWSFNVLFARMLAGVVPPFTLILLRCIVAFVCFAPFAGKTFLREWHLVRSRLRFYIIFSLAGFGLFNAVIYLAGQTTSVINMALLNTSTPVFALILARVFFSEPLTLKRLFGISAAILGVALFTTRGDLTLLKSLTLQIGDLYMLGAAFLFACYTVGVRSKSPELSNSSLIFTSFVISALFLLPVSAWEITSGKPLLVTPASVTGVLYLGIVVSIICYICWTGAISRIGPSNTSLIYYILPLFSGIEAVLIAGESLHWYHFASGALIILGVLVATRKPG